MAPTLLEGDWVLVAVPRRFRRGQVVVVEHPGRPGYELIKRIVAIPGDEIDRRVLRSDEFWIEGDDPSASTDSRHFGPVRRDHLRARVVAVYRPMSRRGLVR
jgi:nickel-type superoxide dismutase maturation protease